MITTASDEWPSDVVIGAWRESGLHVPCKIRLKLFTLEDDLIVESIGHLADADCNAVGTGLRRAVTSAQ